MELCKINHYRLSTKSGLVQISPLYHSCLLKQLKNKQKINAVFLPNPSKNNNANCDTIKFINVKCSVAKVHRKVLQALGSQQ